MRTRRIDQLETQKCEFNESTRLSEISQSENEKPMSVEAQKLACVAA